MKHFLKEILIKISLHIWSLAYCEFVRFVEHMYAKSKKGDRHDGDR